MTKKSLLQHLIERKVEIKVRDYVIIILLNSHKSKCTLENLPSYATDTAQNLAIHLKTD
jgi:hypothetical protein